MKESQNDVYNWRHATEVWKISVDMVLEDLTHTAHKEYIG